MNPRLLFNHLRRFGCLTWVLLTVVPGSHAAEIPASIQTVLENTQPLVHPLRGRLPLFVLPISQALQSAPDDVAEKLLRQLHARGIGYTVNWQPANFDAAVKEGLRIARLQQKIGQPVAVDATACLQRFCDGSPETLHIDRDGHRYSDKSCGGELGCPLALEPRIPAIRRQVEAFVKAYHDAGVHLDFVFADWEIDGPIEWNDSWAAAQRCQRCCDGIPGIHDFRQFQATLRRIRSKLQREAFAEVVLQQFPQALVGNYAVYPHDGYRYWYDYFEQPVNDKLPFRGDQRARYREWYSEFPETHYTFAMPVVYTWYPTFAWYDYQPTDYRWFYNMLLVGSNAGRHTPANVPLIPFIHWHTTAPPDKPDPSVVPMSESAYQELLWQLLLRGHDTFFLWCPSDELASEVRLIHQVFAEANEFDGFLRRGKPVCFEVPAQPTTVVSGLRLGDRVLVRRTDFGSGEGSRQPVQLALNDTPGEQIEIPAKTGPQIVDVQPRGTPAPFLKHGADIVMPLGWYDIPARDEELQELADAGINLVRCRDRADLDRAQSAGLLGWLPLAVQQGDTPALRRQIEAVVDHPALAVWEGPDEIVWTFTAYSGLAKSAGVSKEDWYEQRPNARQYAAAQAAQLLPKLREGVALVKSLDERHRLFWMNEAADSDVRYVREYTGVVDAIGCDYYPVRRGDFDLRSIGKLVDRWQAVGPNKPVWMVLQAFSWHTAVPERGRRYPSFSESRYMAYAAIAHGAKALLYWGSVNIDDPQFRQSLYALASELSAIQPFLVAADLPDVRAEAVPDVFDPPGTGVRAVGRQVGNELLVILANEDTRRHLGTVVHGLSAWNGKKLFELYGEDEATVVGGDLVVRLRPLEVKTYSTTRRFEISRRAGRDYVATPDTK